MRPTPEVSELVFIPIQVEEPAVLRSDAGTVASLWNENALSWSAARLAGGQAVVDKLYGDAVMRLIGPKPGMRLLDVGCGEGGFARRAAAAGAKVFAVDISTAMVAIAKRAESANPLGIEYMACNIIQVETPRRFDAAMAIMSLKDMVDAAGAIQKISQLVEAGGPFVFVIYHPCFSAPGSGWRRIANEPFWQFEVGEYGTERPVLERWRPEGATDLLPTPIFHFHRRLGTYFEYLRSGGFLVNSLEEVHAAPREAPQGFNADLPLFLIVGAIRS